MVSVWSLWLPVIVSGVVLFFASWLAWMILPHHKPEWTGLPNEDATLKALRDLNIPPGQYTFPHPSSPKDFKSETFQARLKAGPNGTLSIWRGPGNMGMNMVCTLLFFVVVNFVIAYLAALAELPPGAGFKRVFQFVGTAGILAYATADIVNGIWFRRKMAADVVDGFAYGLITGLIFALLWPGAPPA